MLDKNLQITIVGLGLLGGSYAQGFYEAGYTVNGIDTDENAVQYALQQGWIKKGSTDVSLLKESDIVISTLYPLVLKEWIQTNGRLLKEGSIFTDVTGVKRQIIDAVNANIPETVEFIACHPMAGREFRGIQYADARRFHDANFIIVPTEHNTKKAIDLAEDIAHALKFQRISVLTAEEHDKMIGYLSQLTHVIAVSLMNMSDNEHLVSLTGDSFRDLTRIANINERLWPQLFILNKDYLVKEIDGFIHEMESFKQMIETEDEEGMKEKLLQSTERRKKFDRK